MGPASFGHLGYQCSPNVAAGGFLNQLFWLLILSHFRTNLKSSKTQETSPDLTQPAESCDSWEAVLAAPPRLEGSWAAAKKNMLGAIKISSTPNFVCCSPFASYFCFSMFTIGSLLNVRHGSPQQISQWTACAAGFWTSRWDAPWRVCPSFWRHHLEMPKDWPVIPQKCLCLVTKTIKILTSILAMKTKLYGQQQQPHILFTS